jgi:diacylglycerol kinase (ATP)
MDFLKGRLYSIRFALAGITRLIRDEMNARVHAAATVLVVVAGIWVRLTGLEWAVIALTVCAVWSAEAANSALERLADVVSLERHPGIGAAKDLAAGAVFLVCIGAVIVGALIFGAHLIPRIR